MMMIYREVLPLDKVSSQTSKGLLTFVQRWQMSGVVFIQHTLCCLGTLIHKGYLGAVFLNRDRLIELCISLSRTLIILVPAIIF